MAIRLTTNPYSGINAHLHSFLQGEAGGWESFYSNYNTYLRVALDAQLPQGYFVRSEKSLQISEITPAGEASPSRTRPDLLIYQARQSTERTPTPQTATPTLTLPLAETLAEEEFLTGLVIYRTDTPDTLGHPVTRLEVLSPFNKPRGSYGRRRQADFRFGSSLSTIICRNSFLWRRR